MNRWSTVLALAPAAIGCLVVIVLGSALFLAGPLLAQPAPEFKLGFKTMADQIPQVVGEPVESERHDEATGDALQRTTTGLMVWRKADNWTAFTDGSRTWVNGPDGIQVRANDQRFEWEPPDSAPALASAQIGRLVLEDEFAGGNSQLPWEPFPHFNLDNLRADIDQTSPSRDKGIGILENANAGGFAALAYVAADTPRDFYLQSWVFTTTTREARGALQGLVFRVNPTDASFYRIAAKFTSDQELSVAYVGTDTNNFPVLVKSWTGAELPGGPVTTDGWHRVGVEVVDKSAQFYWDGQRLPGEPYDVGRASGGFVGTYATFTGGLGKAQTRVDSFRVWEVTGTVGP